MTHRSVPESDVLRARALIAGRVALAVAVTAFVAYYAADFARDPGLQAPLSAAWLWAASLAWIVVTVAILDVRAEFPAAYYRIRPFEWSGRLYRTLGVHLALRVMPHGEYVNRLTRRLGGGSGPVKGPASARRWFRETRSKEFGHVSHLLMTLPAAAVFLANGWLASLAAVAALDVAGDLFPVMGQRYNRIRLERMFAAKRNRAAGSRPPMPTPRTRD